MAGLVRCIKHRVMVILNFSMGCLLQFFLRSTWIVNRRDGPNWLFGSCNKPQKKWCEFKSFAGDLKNSVLNCVKWMEVWRCLFGTGNSCFDTDKNAWFQNYTTATGNVCERFISHNARLSQEQVRNICFVSSPQYKIQQQNFQPTQVTSAFTPIAKANVNILWGCPDRWYLFWVHQLRNLWASMSYCLSYQCWVDTPLYETSLLSSARSHLALSIANCFHNQVSSATKTPVQQQVWPLSTK